MKKKKLQPIFEKTYYHPTFFDNSTKDGKDTDNYSGTLLTQTYTIKQYASGVRLSQNTNVISFSGVNRSEMRKDLKSKIKGMNELSEKADGNRAYIPPEVSKKLKELKTQPMKNRKKHKQTMGDSINLITSAIENVKQKKIDKIYSRLQEMSPQDVQQLARIINLE